MPENNENPLLCSACQGECCRTKPGIEAPERFLATDDPAGAVYQALASGMWVLERHMGLPVTAETVQFADRMDRITYYPRPATRAEHAKGSTMAEIGSGECIFLEENGCRLIFDDRPRMCRALEPESSCECKSSWTRPDAALAWFPWQGLIEKALRKIAKPYS